MFMLVIRLSAVFIAIAASGSVIEQALSSVAQQSAADVVLSRPPSQSNAQFPATIPHPLSRSSLHFALPRRAYLLQNVHPPVAAAAGRITGTVRFRHRVALPPDAVVLVQLQDVFLPDAPSPFLAESKTTVGLRQVPIPFTLKFDPAKIDPKHPYAVEASILVHNQLRFTNDTAYLVLTQGHPAKVDMILVEVDAPRGTKP